MQELLPPWPSKNVHCTYDLENQAKHILRGPVVDGVPSSAWRRNRDSWGSGSASRTPELLQPTHGVGVGFICNDHQKIWKKRMSYLHCCITRTILPIRVLHCLYAYRLQVDWWIQAGTGCQHCLQIDRLFANLSAHRTWRPVSLLSKNFAYIPFWSSNVAPLSLSISQTHQMALLPSSSLQRCGTNAWRWPKCPGCQKNTCIPFSSILRSNPSEGTGWRFLHEPK